MANAKMHVRELKHSVLFISWLRTLQPTGTVAGSAVLDIVSLAVHGELACTQ